VHVLRSDVLRSDGCFDGRRRVWFVVVAAGSLIESTYFSIDSSNFGN
jgi:hypothetical protein